MLNYVQRVVFILDLFTILNYQGSKKNLIDFIHNNTLNYIDEKKAILDIFSGSCSVGYSFKQDYKVFANDSEQYSSIIAEALLSKTSRISIEELKNNISKLHLENQSKLNTKFGDYLIIEKKLLTDNDRSELIKLYEDYPTIWNSKNSFGYSENIYSLFTTYYAGTYFGIEQCFEIDSIRYAIESFSNNKKLKSVLLSCLFFAMKECVFSKDGHMAQPLSPSKNIGRLQKQRNKSIAELFLKKLEGFFSEAFINIDNGNAIFNENFKDILKNKKIQEEVGFIYADPPYTDMQYSRYYHLLNVAAKYDYPLPTIIKKGYTKGLYTENRFQSQLSQKQGCLKSFSELIQYTNCYKKNLAISFAYPKEPELQKTNRYVMSIQEIIFTCENTFGKPNVKVESIDYTHSNNRNSQSKKVLEYLVMCKGVQ